jgi:hypothetical protein
VGPSDERWDLVTLVRQASINDFLAFASDQSYLAGTAHRIAALEDSRLLPVVVRVMPLHGRAGSDLGHSALHGGVSVLGTLISVIVVMEGPGALDR